MYNVSDETIYDVILSRHRRETNTSAVTSTEDEDLFTKNNNLAMFVVVPVLVFVYGGCACIYCCYKCRKYMRENQPIRKFKQFINKDYRKDDDEDDNNNVSQSEASASRRNSGEASARSLASSPGPETDASYVEFDDSAMSTPGLGYPARRSLNKKGSLHILEPIDNEDNSIEANNAPNEGDSGIQGDSNLTDFSGSSSTSRVATALPAPMTARTLTQVACVEVSRPPQTHAAPMESKRTTKPQTSEIGVQTEDVIIMFKTDKGGEVDEKDKPPTYAECINSTTTDEDAKLSNDNPDCDEEFQDDPYLYELDEEAPQSSAGSFTSSSMLVSAESQEIRKSSRSGNLQNKPRVNLGHVVSRYLDQFKTRQKTAAPDTSGSPYFDTDSQYLTTSKAPEFKHVSARYLDHYKRKKAKDSNDTAVAETTFIGSVQATFVGSTNVPNNAQSKADKQPKPNVIRVTPRYLDHFGNKKSQNDDETRDKATPLSSKKSFIKEGKGNKSRKEKPKKNSGATSQQLSIVSLENEDPKQYIVPSWK